jgi:hypothetical protein
LFHVVRLGGDSFIHCSYLLCWCIIIIRISGFFFRVSLELFIVVRLIYISRVFVRTVIVLKSLLCVIYLVFDSWIFLFDSLGPCTVDSLN